MSWPPTTTPYLGSVASCEDRILVHGHSTRAREHFTCSRTVLSSA